MRVFLTGSTGQLGIALQRALQGHAVDAPPEDQADITSASIIDRIVSSQPEVVIHAAAFTDVDGAQADPERAFAVNATGSRHVARAAARCGARLVAVSTDYVYDGTKATPYTEDDPVAPLGVYGASKLEGECETLAEKSDAIILRTAWLYGDGKNFVRTILRVAADRDELRVVDDQIGSPTWAEDLARAIVAVLGTPASGVYHAVNDGSCSWFGFACEILRLAGLERRVVPIRTEELARPAPRPARSTLDCRKLAALGIRFRPWRDALADYLKRPVGTV